MPAEPTTPYDPDALALASMIADHLRGRPIAVNELPPSARTLVTAYVAAHDYGPHRGQDLPTAHTFMGAPLRARITARGPDGRVLPVLPVIRREPPPVIDVETSQTSDRELPGVGGNVDHR